MSATRVAAWLVLVLVVWSVAMRTLPTHGWWTR